MSKKATMASSPRGSYRHQHDTRQARDRSMYVLGYLQSAYLFDIKPMCTQSQTLRANTFTREQTYVALRTYELYEHTCSVFPPIEQASAFTFAGRISAHGSILTLPTGWRTDILSGTY